MSRASEGPLGFKDQGGLMIHSVKRRINGEQYMNVLLYVEIRATVKNETSECCSGA